jgi:hypothetical protein
VNELAAAVTSDLAAAIAALELQSVVAGGGRLRSHAGIGDEVERLAIGLFRVMQARRTAIMVLDRCAGEIPEFADVWFGEVRYAIVELWTDYLALRSAAIGSVDRSILARTIVEIITTRAVKMPWHQAPRPYPADTARRAPR